MYQFLGFGLAALGAAMLGELTVFPNHGLIHTGDTASLVVGLFIGLAALLGGGVLGVVTSSRAALDGISREMNTLF